MVPETSKKWFPQMALGFDDSRVSVHITDGETSCRNTYTEGQFILTYCRMHYLQWET